MPQYCKSCALAFEGARCPGCGSKRVREVTAEDACFLTEKDLIWAGMLTDVLTQNGIPFLTRNVMGAGLTAWGGSLRERVRVYVPWGRREEAERLVEALFSEENDGLEEEST